MIRRRQFYLHEPTFTYLTVSLFSMNCVVVFLHDAQSGYWLFLTTALHFPLQVRKSSCFGFDLLQQPLLYRSFNDNSWRFHQIFISISLLQGQACRRQNICRCCMVKIPKGNTSRNCLPATMSWKEVSWGTPYYLILLYKDSRLMAMLSGSVWYLILHHFTLHELNMYSWHT